MPFGLGVEVDVFGFKWLINELSSFGFSVSLDEVLSYKQCVTEKKKLEFSIQNIMTGSAISDRSKLIYGSNTIQYILSGKAVSRALRGHALIE